MVKAMDVSRYLQKVAGSVRTKKYVLLLQKSRYMAEQEVRVISKAVEHALSGYIQIRLDDPAEGLKVLNVKNVEVVILHYSLMSNEADLVDLAKQLKERKKVTVLFVTNNERALIDAYREKMSLYEELDDFVAAPIDPAELYRKLQKSGSVEARAAKRFSIDVPVKLTRVDNLEEVDATLADLSLVGAGLDVRSDTPMRRDEQLRVQIPLYPFGIFHPQYGDFLKLSLRLRRIAIKGDNIGCSIEHLTPMQHDCLVNLLEDVSRRQRIFRMTNKDKKGAQLNAK
ncbi:MAG: PilZ domain-containing protein [Betaproteobacteria bacterium]|nr:PilZ domain-containing protein [Betaproteobacteria bacterium]